MAKLTAAQKKWIAGVQKALNAPGSEGLAFATGGDPNIIIYEGGHEEELNEYRGDPVSLAQQKDWILCQDLNFPSAVEGWCI